MLTSGLFSRNGEKFVSIFVFVFYRRQSSTINNSAIISFLDCELQKNISLTPTLTFSRVRRVCLFVNVPSEVKPTLLLRATTSSWRLYLGRGGRNQRQRAEGSTVAAVQFKPGWRWWIINDVGSGSWYNNVDWGVVLIKKSLVLHC